MTEEYRPIPGFPCYVAGSEGNIRQMLDGGRSLRVLIVRDPGKVPKCRARSTESPQPRDHSVDYLVALAFLGERDGHWVWHSDRDPENCRADNLSWASSERPWETIEGAVPIEGLPSYALLPDGNVVSFPSNGRSARLMRPDAKGRVYLTHPDGSKKWMRTEVARAPRRQARGGRNG
jgi:hypothetical protein